MPESRSHGFLFKSPSFDIGLSERLFDSLWGSWPSFKLYPGIFGGGHFLVELQFEPEACGRAYQLITRLGLLGSTGTPGQPWR